MSAKFIKADHRLERLLGGSPPPDLPARVSRAADKAVAEVVANSSGDILVLIEDLWQLVDNDTPGQLLDMDQIFLLGHDLRGLCATIGHPVAGAIADALCTYIEDARAIEYTPRSNTVWLHISSLKRAVEEKQSADILGRYLIDSLCALRHKELSQKCPEYCSCDFRPSSPGTRDA